MTLGETFMKPTHDALSQPAGDGGRGGAPLVSRRRRGADGRLRQDRPGAGDGRARAPNLPALFFPAGPMLRGNWHGQILGSGSDVWKYWTERRAGKLDECALARDGRRHRALATGTCMTMGTASTMAAAVDALGLTLPGASSIPAADSAHSRMATASGRRIVEMVWEDLKPRDILTTEAFENAVTADDGARRIDQRHHPPDRDGRAGRRQRSTSIASMRCRGGRRSWRTSGRRAKFLMEDFYYAGGLRGLLNRLRDRLHVDCMTVNGRTLGQNLDDASVCNDEVIAPARSADRSRGRRCGAARQPGARRRRHQAHGRGAAAAAARGTGRRLPRTTTTSRRGSTIRRSP